MKKMQKTCFTQYKIFIFYNLFPFEFSFKFLQLLLNDFIFIYKLHKIDDVLHLS